MIVQTLTDFLKCSRRLLTKPVLSFLNQISNQLIPTSHFPHISTSSSNSNDISRLYALALTKLSKLLSILLPLISQIGQLQLLRKSILAEIRLNSTQQSPSLSTSLLTFDQALSNQLQLHYQSPDHIEAKYPNNMGEIVELLENTGKDWIHFMSLFLSPSISIFLSSISLSISLYIYISISIYLSVSISCNTAARLPALSYLSI
jgi:hypothetical protein